jgi:hypothetical protein
MPQRHGTVTDEERLNLRSKQPRYRRIASGESSSHQNLTQREVLLAGAFDPGNHVSVWQVDVDRRSKPQDLGPGGIETSSPSCLSRQRERLPYNLWARL